MTILFLCVLTAFLVTYLAIPSIISIAHEKHLFDEPDYRSSHQKKTPALGGIAIFSGAILAFVLWTPILQFSDLQYILCAFIILFLVGARDDISPLSPRYKLLGQLLATFIFVFKSKVMLSGLYGLFGFQNVFPEWFSIIITIFCMISIINAFNLIDGIDGLAGSIGILILGTLGVWFYMVGKMGYAAVAFSIVGATMAFLKYNFAPAKIFMGDAGSLLIGLAVAILIIEFIVINDHLPMDNQARFENIPAVAIGIMILPLFDATRVFLIRISKGISPFRPDKRHLHHLLLDYGYSHTKATLILFFANMSFICMVFGLHDKMEMHYLFLLEIGIAGLLTGLLQLLILKKKRKHRVTSGSIQRELINS